MSALVASAQKVGFACVAVQPASTTAFTMLSRLQHAGHVYLLDPPKRPLRPRTQWCSSPNAYAWRRMQLARALMLERILTALADHKGGSVLALDVRSRLQANPVQFITGLNAHDGPRPDIVYRVPAQQKLVGVGLIWIRSTPMTRALATTVANRTWATGDAIAFAEELNFGVASQGLGCCHTRCLDSFVTQRNGSLAAASEPLTGSACSDEGPPAAPPQRLAMHRWRRRWRPNVDVGIYNDPLKTLSWLKKSMRYGATLAACTRPHAWCTSPNASASDSPYPRNMMFGARNAFSAACVQVEPAQWLRSLPPSVLHASRIQTLNVGLPATVSVPLGGSSTRRARRAKLRFEARDQPRQQPIRWFNPSVVRAPSGLCKRCAFVLSLRVDAMHQCRNGPLTEKRLRKRPHEKFRATAIAVLDERLRSLGWTWLLNAVPYQVDQTGNRSVSELTGKVPTGASDGFTPPWIRTVFDARLLSVNGSLLAVLKLPRQPAMTLATVQLTAMQTADGSVAELRAWCSQRWTVADSWARGRNQALFASATAEVMIQPWLGLVATLGRPQFVSQERRCLLNRRGEFDRQMLFDCGSHPVGSRLALRVASTDSFGKAELLYNHSHSQSSEWLQPKQVLVDHGSRPGSFGVDFSSATYQSTAPGFKASATANLLHIERGAGGRRPPCGALLGIGHFHRAEGKQNRFLSKLRDAFTSEPLLGHGTVDYEEQHFQFGALYTHFLYTIQPHPPYRMLGTSAEFCIGASQDAGDCESVQFVSGLELHNGSQTLILAYGVNDCEAKLAEVPLSRAWQMLSPLPGETDVCSQGM